MSSKAILSRPFTVAAVTSVIATAIISPYVSAANFTDVSAKYKEAVHFVGSKGVEGLSKGTFGVNTSIKRVDAAIMLSKVLGLNTKNAPASGFTDVPARASEHINALKFAGITDGKTKTTFDSHSMITRGELARWIQKGFKLNGATGSNFTDVPQSYQESVSSLVHNKITTGISSSQFGTNKLANRGDFAIFLYKASQVTPEQK